MLVGSGLGFLCAAGFALFEHDSSPSVPSAGCGSLCCVSRYGDCTAEQAGLQMKLVSGLGRTTCMCLSVRLGAISVYETPGELAQRLPG